MKHLSATTALAALALVAACAGDTTAPTAPKSAPLASAFDVDSHLGARYIVVKPSSMHGWYFWNDYNDTFTGSPGALVVGPANPPLGIGSVRLGPLTTASGATGQSVIATNEFFGTELGPGDVTGAYAGVRPLISTGDSRKSVDISRKAELYETSSGLITITGGKLTTWRRMAKLAVDRLVERDGRNAPCRTHEIPLGEPVDAGRLPRVHGVDPGSYEQLAGRYGHAAERVLQTAAERDELAQPIVAGLPDLLAEAPFAARFEQARSIGDVLLRRTRLGLLAARELCSAGSQVPDRVGRAIGAELGWDQRRVALEVERFGEEARAEGIVVEP